MRNADDCQISKIKFIKVQFASSISFSVAFNPTSELGGVGEDGIIFSVACLLDVIDESWRNDST